MEHLAVVSALTILEYSSAALRGSFSSILRAASRASRHAAAAIVGG